VRAVNLTVGLYDYFRALDKNGGRSIKSATVDANIALLSGRKPELLTTEALNAVEVHSSSPVLVPTESQHPIGEPEAKVIWQRLHRMTPGTLHATPNSAA